MKLRYLYVDGQNKVKTNEECVNYVVVCPFIPTDFDFSKISFIIYLAALDLTYSAQDLLSLLQHVGSLVVAYGI